MSDYIQNIGRGNHKSFEIVFKLWHRKVYGYFLKKTACDEISQELTQLTFIKLWRFKHTLVEDYPLDVQLFKIAKTTLLDYLKKLANDKHNLKLYSSSLEDSFSEQNLQFDTKTQLEVVLNCLPPMRKKIFLLSRIQGYSYKEIASQLSISPRTVEKHISLAIKQLNGYAYFLIFISFINAIS